jgi:hypothetical protein
MKLPRDDPKRGPLAEELAAEAKAAVELSSQAAATLGPIEIRVSRIN